MPAPIIEVDNLAKEFRAGRAPVEALADVSFAVDEGQFVTLVGPSGCGKSTLLQILAGLVAADQPARRASTGERMAAPMPDKIGMVFQDPTCCRGRRRSPTSNSRSTCAASTRAARRERCVRAARAGGARASSPSTIRTSCRAACASASRSRADWRRIRA